MALEVCALGTPDVPGEASGYQPPVDAREALAELRGLVRSLPEPTRSQYKQALTVVSRSMKKTRAKRDKECRDSSRFLRTMVDRYATQVADSDFEEDLGQMAADVDYFRGALGAAVRARQASGRHSWADIGRALKMSPQAAWKRWGEQ